MKPSDLPLCWRTALEPQFAAPYFQELLARIEKDRSHFLVFPLANEVFSAFRLTPLEAVKVVLLGQDPYHGDGQAHGLCFSVRPSVEYPPSLRNILRELQTDTGCNPPGHGCLEAWARQGVLMLNAVLTVRANEPNSHQGWGWEQFTDAAIAAVNAKRDPVVFALWGSAAQKKAAMIDAGRHVILTAPHPSPLSAYRGFFGSRPFSRINQALIERGREPIDWDLAAAGNV